jgi:hypothetical protein
MLVARAALFWPALSRLSTAQSTFTHSSKRVHWTFQPNSLMIVKATLVAFFHVSRLAILCRARNALLPTRLLRWITKGRPVCWLSWQSCVSSSIFCSHSKIRLVQTRIALNSVSILSCYQLPTTTCPLLHSHGESVTKCRCDVLF